MNNRVENLKSSEQSVCPTGSSSLDFLSVVCAEAEPRDDVSVDAEALLLDVAGHGKGGAHQEQGREECLE